VKCEKKVNIAMKLPANIDISSKPMFWTVHNKNSFGVRRFGS